MLFAIVILIPLIVAIAGYVVLRQRNRSPFAAGCASIVAGVLVSFAISGLFFLAGWA